jgi:hypothetical protein
MCKLMIQILLFIPQFGEGNIDHPHYDVNKNLNNPVERKYVMIEREGVGMTLSLHKYRCSLS